ncbi:MAG TPA: 50S ribosomal protein L4 [Candidatus Dormibacteraeota bacterium]|nr:50S ribosomal protein L4 [Candidatus Dormibacteraeota bacterium]
MPVVNVVNLEGKPVGEVELAESVFAARVNQHLLHAAVRWQLAGRRAGTHKVKNRGEVRGAGRKLWRQKGTGRARMGSVRSPLWRHGGTVHGPTPRDYSYRLPKKMVLGALRSALSAKLSEGSLTVVEAWSLDSHKTKALREILNRFEQNSGTALLVTQDENHNLALASRNLDGVMLLRPGELGAYEILRHKRLVLSKDAALRLSASLGASAGSASEEPGSEGQ